MQPYFMAYCIESLPQPFSNWKFNWRWRDLNPGPSKYQSNMLPTELSWLDQFSFHCWFQLGRKRTSGSQKAVFREKLSMGTVFKIFQNFPKKLMFVVCCSLWQLLIILASSCHCLFNCYLILFSSSFPTKHPSTELTSDPHGSILKFLPCFIQLTLLDLIGLTELWLYSKVASMSSLEF